MIDYLVTGEFSRIQLRVYIILAMWVMMVMAVCMDLWAGVNSARARGEVINSGGFRRTIGKLGDYWRIQVMALIFDVIGSCIPWYEYPYASMIVTAAIVLIEGRSVWENERAKKGNVAKLPAAIRDIINCTTAKSAEGLLKKIKELDDGQKAT